MANAVVTVTESEYAGHTQNDSRKCSTQRVKLRERRQFASNGRRGGSLCLQQLESVHARVHAAANAKPKSATASGITDNEAACERSSRQRLLRACSRVALR